MRYLLNERYRLRGWQKNRTGLYDTERKEPLFLDKESYLLVMRCDGAHDLEEDTLSQREKEALEEMLRREVVRPAGFAEFLREEQEYKVYPAEYKRQVHWSITGACNLKCRHCFVSAPHAKHGAPTHEQIIAIADQLAECGIFQVGLTGGEPLVREDFLEIVDALAEREIGIDVIYTNGWLTDEKLLDALDRRGMHPPFQLSFDGIGQHDFLRGIPGAEERTIKALKLLQERKHRVSVSMCIHRKNLHTVRESIRLMGSLGVGSMKCGAMMEMGEWLNPEVRDLQLTPEEELAFCEEYIPQYFEDDAPVSIMIGGKFMYTPGDPEWGIFAVRKCSAEDEDDMPSCGVLIHNFYIGAEGMVCPCMGMADTGYAKHFPNLFETPLKEILGNSEMNRLCHATVKEVRDGNDKCRACRFIDRCAGGCRNGALMAGDNYFGVDPDVCRFFELDGEARITRAAQGPFEAYLKRHPPREKPAGDRRPETDVTDCP